MDDFGFADGEDVLDVLADDFEGERAERGLEAVGDSVGVGGDDFAGVEGLLGVIGLLGLGMRWLDMPVVPLLLALVLGRPLEEHLRIALTGSQGDVSIFFTSPFSVFFLGLAAVSIVWSIVSARRLRPAGTARPGFSE